MADLTITATSVLSGAKAVTEQGVAGEALTAGQVVYKAAATGKWMKADANAGTAEPHHAEGVALNGAAVNQPVLVEKSGEITIGATLTPGSPYYLSATAGGICPAADLTTGMAVCQLGLAKSASVLVIDIQFPSVTL
ncbi:MAG TPA: hypothetical protein VL358_04595 [Caulobacteraceae bacterium]|jgi:hypothetical protein|nr:hypothetical protein [Caulobacteraceae bacterium]